MAKTINNARMAKEDMEEKKSEKTNFSATQ